MLFIKTLAVLALSAFAVATPAADNASPAVLPVTGADAAAQDPPYGYGYQYKSDRRLSEGFCRKFGREKEEHCRREVRRCDRFVYERDERECYEQVERKYRRSDWQTYRGY